MGGPKAAYASNASVAAAPRAQSLRDEPLERPLRKDTSMRFRAQDNNQDSADDETIEDDDDDDYDYYAAEEERERELREHRAEMKARFNFPAEKRQNMRNNLMNAMKRKRRLLMRNENLRFRELYRPPEPMVVITAIALVTIITLILTKSWPFY
ncbi:hypothetical protein Poli38472_001998 [Pythium oligandrum]|uniref:Uncharacterized protein n=1 Tax=Pythium oligandrum TaxID=41045 RepID=A0A8K1FSA6_PYTOL|nr:hypothetical protein Poli38472_001998 [Pythium oligandrum]|eukprot:TMW69842.1 hypothetical protein Poli38472_001998 [Pythium oligandrum]